MNQFQASQQASAELVPARAIDGQHGVCARPDAGADFSQVQVHHLGVGRGQHQRSSGAAGRAYGAEQIGPSVALVSRRGGP